MATNQTRLLDGIISCASLTGELGANGTFLFCWIRWFPQTCVCVALEEVVVALTHSYDTLRFPDTESFGSPMQHTLRLLDSWRSSASMQSSQDGHARSPKTSSP